MAKNHREDIGWRRAFWCGFVCLVLWLALVPPAHAYLDPGSGSMFVQLLLGGVAGLFVLVKMYWRQLAAKFGRKPDEDGQKAGPQ